MKRRDQGSGIRGQGRYSFLIPNLWPLIPIFLASCALRPVYGEQYQAERAVVTAGLAHIAVETPHDRAGELLGAELRDALNPTHQPAQTEYRLRVRVRETTIPLFVAPDGTYGRGNIQYEASYTLTRLADGATVDAGQLTQVASFAASEVNAMYASHVAQQDARKRGIVELARRLSLTLANRLDRPALTPMAAPGARVKKHPLVELPDTQTLTTLGVEP